MFKGTFVAIAESIAARQAMPAAGGSLQTGWGPALGDASHWVRRMTTQGWDGNAWGWSCEWAREMRQSQR